MADRTRRALSTLVAAATFGAAIAAAPAGERPADRATDDRPARQAIEALDSTTEPFSEHQPTAQDRYSLANGCFVLRSATSGGFVTQDGDTFTATAPSPAQAEPFHLEPFDLGKYLFYAPNDQTDPDDLHLDGDFFAAAPGPVEQSDDTRQELEGRAPVTTGTALPNHSDAPNAHDPDGDQLPSTVGNTIVVAAEPSPAAEWIVRGSKTDGFTIHLPVDDGAEDHQGPSDVDGDAPVAKTLTTTEDGTLVLVDGEVTDSEARFDFRRAPGRLECPVWPEVDVGVSGEPYTADTGYEEARGYVDGHLHMMAFEFLGGRARCGAPWHPYGVSYALVDCEEHEPGGAGDALEFALSGVAEHDTTGWPSFPYWPDDQSLTHEQVYYRWLERAWRGGLRMFTNLLVENSALCDLYPYKENSCNEMESVRLQAQRLRELERYIDAQHGGPGQGWFRIVTDPFEARRTVNEGRLAVVMGIEVSVLFDCGEFLGVMRCDEGQIDEQLQEVWDLGVRQMELVNKFDNALSGVAGDSGTTGPIVNQGNKYETGHYWMMDTCSVLADEGHDHHGTDKQQPNLHDDSGSPEPLTGRDSLAGGILALFGRSGTVPVYPEGPHCNTIGLRPLGRYVIQQMMERGMIFDPDHMSAAGRADAMEVLAAHDSDGDGVADGYSGVISSHGWADRTTEKEVWPLGGVVTPMQAPADWFVEKWRRQHDFADPRFVFGLGYGADTNGFAGQSPPRDPADGRGVTYPFEGLGGVTVERQISGERVYDINVDGVDHYGLYADWVEDIRVVAEQKYGAGDEVMEDMARASEAYLQMWERAVGIAGNACRSDIPALTAEQLDRATAGMTPEQVLAALGQPDARIDDRFEYCTEDGRVTLAFDRDRKLVGQQQMSPGGADAVSGAVDETPAASEGGEVAATAPHDHASHDHTSMRAAGAVSGADEPSSGSPLLHVLLLVSGLAGLAVHGLRRASG
ncbi:MAG: hypothetical protein R3343_06920 [Nitriliruptorales bacterium]|nr:hypothetical protein [Nitriliruptorales bacterium]